MPTISPKIRSIAFDIAASSLVAIPDVISVSPSGGALAEIAYASGYRKRLGDTLDITVTSSDVGGAWIAALVAAQEAGSEVEVQITPMVGDQLVKLGASAPGRVVSVETLPATADQPAQVTVVFQFIAAPNGIVSTAAIP